MSRTVPYSRMVAVVTLVGLILALMTPVSHAVVSRVQARTPEVVTADALPTAQINGVAWDQAIVGDTVFVGGNFSAARPAGAASGVNESPRSHLMSYRLSTGTMTTWNPGANAQIRALAVSPDGTRVYVGGDFTQVAGQNRSRIAAFSATTGQLISSFAPPVGYTVNDVVATNDTVYVAGNFAGVGSQPRANLAAFDAGSGALLGWAPGTDRQVLSIALTEDGAAVLAGGYFETVNGAPVRGLAKIDAVGGQVLPWPVPISNAGADSAVNNLKVEGDMVFGSGFHFGPGGNQEGPWQLKVSTGELVWVADCHGDTYDIHPSTVVYAVGHAHYCGNVSMGFPQYSTWRYQHSMAWTREPTGTNIREVYGYANWDGQPSPSIVGWLPTMSIGSFTGQYQAGWTVEGQGDFIVVGGEFPRVNNGAQQGLVRFAKRPVAPGLRGPSFTGGVFAPDLQAIASDAVKVSWTAGFDQDDHELTYQVVRSGTGVVHETTASSTWWDTPGLAWVDRTVTPGASYTYSLRARDSAGNQVFGASRTITVPVSVPRTDYGHAVLASEPVLYWPLDEVSGTAIADHSGGNRGLAGSGVTYGASGAVPDSTSVVLNGTTQGRINSVPQSHAPTEMSAQVWFRTTDSYGRLLGFGDLATGNSGHRDRQLYLNNGRLSFGVRAQGTKVVTSNQTYRDNEWHHAVATLFGPTMRLYVDGVLVAQRHDAVEPEEYVGHWRLGGDSQSGWNVGTDVNYAGQVDEVSVYDRALSADEVDALYVAAGRVSNRPPVPEDTYGAGVVDLQPDLYWRLNEASGSSAADSSGFASNGTYQGTHTKGIAGALLEVADTAVSLDGSSGYVVSEQSFTNPQVFSTEAWFRTTTSRGGKIIGLGNQQTSLSSNYDRHTFMLDDGRLVFGVWAGQEQRATTTGSYNDGNWHHVVSMLSPDGMKLYVDGVLAATNPTTVAENYSGYWRAGGDRTWSGSSSNFFAGVLDEVAVYPRALTESEVGSNYARARGAEDPPNTAPSAQFSFVADHLGVTFDGRASSDVDGSVQSWAWNFGDGTAGTGAQTTHAYAGAGTYPVTLTVTDDDGAISTVTRQVQVVANQPPAAAFTVQTDGLQLTADAASSDDPDGQIVAWSWDFGDGSTGTGIQVSHAYAVAGTYQVTLTVNDDDGATHVASRTVTVGGPVANQPPTAAFTTQVDGLTATLDGRGSSDSDGSVSTWVWDFGDGSSGSGEQTSHAYGAAGSYDVTLTVTDDEGADAALTRTVTVTEPEPPLAASDAFSRTVAPGWGTADAGGAWTTAGPSKPFSVSEGTGRLSMTNRGAVPRVYLDDVSAVDVDLTFDVGFDQVPPDGETYLTTTARRNGTAEVRLTISLTPATTAVTASRVVDGTEVTLASAAAPDLAYRVGDVLKVRYELVGTTIRAKVWRTGTEEPGDWLLTASDAAPELQGPGSIGFSGYLSRASGSAPVVALIDNLLVMRVG